MLNKIVSFLTLIAFLTVSSAHAQVTYVHEDFLGSVAAESNVLGQITKRSHYEPYGEQRTSGISNEAAFTGHVYDADIGLSYMGSRYYDPTIGRFYSDDPVGFLSKNPASFNRYAYANNNPFAYTDPDGELAFLVVVGIVVIANAASIYLEAKYDAENPCGDCVRSSAGIDIGLSGLGAKLATKAVTKRTATLTPNQIGRAGEDAVSAAYNIGSKQTFQINGRTRIPDGVTGTTLSEVKNVKSLSFTRQLRDFADIAKREGLDFDLYVRPSTNLTGPLKQAISKGEINLKLIPEVK